MSVTNTLYIGVSGLDAHGDAISVVGDNIANASTIGYKRARASFADVLGGELGSQRLGGGAFLDATQTMFEQGSIQQTGNGLDVAIRGTGMFVVAGDHDGRTGQFFTRDGRLNLDNAGTLVDARGLNVQGYTIDAMGNRSTTLGDLSLAGRQSPPAVTTTASMTLNLDAQATVPAAWDPAQPAATSNYATSMTVYDSLGTAHTAQVYFRNAGGGTWEWHAMVDDGELGGTPGTLTQIADGTVSFDTAGAFTGQTTASSSASFVGATANQVIAFDFASSTQFSGASTVSGTNVDGHGAGNLIDLAIGADGTVRGIFDNGDEMDVAQLALADFASEDGLIRGGDGLFQATEASGQALIDVAGSGSRGSLVSGALEASNVDLGNELVTLIAYQRAFQANAKTVTTADEMLSEVANLKR